MSSYTFKTFLVEKYGSSGLKCRIGRLHTMSDKFFMFKSKIYMNVVILGPWINGDEIQKVFIKIYIGTSTCRTPLIRCALDRSKSGLSAEFFPDILKAFLTSLD